MTWFQIMWMVAGGLAGWMAIELFAIVVIAAFKCKVEIPLLWNLWCFFIGTLAAYSLVM